MTGGQSLLYRVSQKTASIFNVRYEEHKFLSICSVVNLSRHGYHVGQTPTRQRAGATTRFTSTRVETLSPRGRNESRVGVHPHARGGEPTCAAKRCGRSLRTMFQFHIGSIKTVRVSGYVHGRGGFQFHIGSIKTSCAPARGRSTKRSFNSTLVRLRRVQYALSGHCPSAVSIPHWFD